MMDSIGIAYGAADVAAMERLLVRMAEEQIGRDGDETVAREALRKVTCVPDQAVALVHDDDARHLRVGRWNRNEGRHLAAGGRPCANAAHCADLGVVSGAASARKLASMKPASGSGAANSPMATSASRLALMPSAESAPAGAMTCSLT